MTTSLGSPLETYNKRGGGQSGGGKWKQSEGNIGSSNKLHSFRRNIRDEVSNNNNNGGLIGKSFTQPQSS